MSKRWICPYKKGYRNNDCYNSGVTNIYEIIEHEIDELDNPDIPDCMGEHYDIQLEDNSFVSSQIIAFLKENFPTHKYGLWLAEKDAVEMLYDGNDDNISEYIIPESAIMISDLGYDGFLIVTEEKLEPIGVI